MNKVLYIIIGLFVGLALRVLFVHFGNTFGEGNFVSASRTGEPATVYENKFEKACQALCRRFELRMGRPLNVLSMESHMDCICREEAE